MKSLPPHLKAFVERRIADLSLSTEEEMARGVATDFGDLLLYADMGGALALKPTGELLSIPHDDPDAKLEVDERWRVAALVKGSKKYSELQELLPRRPAEANDCTHCHGTGLFHHALCGAC